MWQRFYRSTGKDTPAAVAIDPYGNVYIAGTTSGKIHGQANAGGTDIFLMKTDKEGNRLWTRTWGTRGNDKALSIRTDSRGGIFLYGTTEEEGTQRGFLVKYTSSGSLHQR